MEKLIPMPGKIIVERQPKSALTERGIILPESAKHSDNYTQGVVVAAGKPVEGNYQFQPGQTILYLHYNSTPIEHEGKKLDIVRELSVTGIIKDNG